MLDTDQPLKARCNDMHEGCSPSHEVAQEIARLNIRGFAALESTESAAWPHTHLVQEYAKECQLYTTVRTATPMSDDYKAMLE